MKIIRKDNFDRENISDVLVATNVNKYYGEIIVKALNARFEDDPNNPDWYVLVEDDYELYKFEV